jgi:enoyl-[acyl-carrier-protein] reductase (NADH)
MFTETPRQVADILEYEMGINPGIDYAYRIARTAAANGSEMAVLYTEAAGLLQDRLRRLHASAESGAFDLGEV